MITTKWSENIPLNRGPNSSNPIIKAFVVTRPSICSAECFSTIMLKESCPKRLSNTSTLTLSESESLFIFYKCIQFVIKIYCHLHKKSFKTPNEKNIICLKFVTGDYSHGNVPTDLKFDWNCCYSHLRLCWISLHNFLEQDLKYCHWMIWPFREFFCKGQKLFMKWSLQQCLRFCFFWQSWSNLPVRFRTFR